jgi:hypothetical protein
MAALVQPGEAGGQPHATQQQPRQPQRQRPALLAPHHASQRNREQVAGQAPGGGAVAQLIEAGQLGAGDRGRGQGGQLSCRYPTSCPPPASVGDATVVSHRCSEPVWAATARLDGRECPAPLMIPSDPRRQAMVDSLRSRYRTAADRNDADAKQALFKEAVYLGIQPEEFTDPDGR